MRKLMVLVGAGLALLAFPASALAAPIVVDTTSDASAPGAPCTLREAIVSANADNASSNGCANGSGTDTISFDPSVTAPAGPQTIALGAVPNLSTNLTIVGPGASELSIAPVASNQRALLASAPAVVTVSGLTVTGASIVGAGNNQGAGIYNNGANLTLTQVTVSNNYLEGNAPAASSVTVDGGGIFNDATATLTLNQSTVEGNTAIAKNGVANLGAEARGGGIHSRGSLHIHDSVIAGNHAIAQDTFGPGPGIAAAIGGGIRSLTGSGATDIDHSQISGNDATGSSSNGSVFAEGGGYAGDSGTTTTVEETTIADNQFAATGPGTLTPRGAGVFTSTGTLNLASTTIARNGPTSGSAPGANIGTAGGTVNLKNSIVSDSRGGGTNCFALVTSTDGYNVDFSAAGTSCGLGGGELATNPMLDPAGLASNGGPTKTIALMPGSPATDAGSNAGQAALFLNQDQRSFLRPVDFPGVTDAAGGNGTDIGAFEVQKACAVQSTPSEACPQPAVNPAQPGATGQRAAALKKCKKKKTSRARKKCNKKAAALPL
jgi:CSLREA domain-containing protein